MTAPNWLYENFEPAGSSIGYRITRKLGALVDQIEAPGDYPLCPGDTVYVYAVDRLGRDALDVQATVRTLIDAGVTVDIPVSADAEAELPEGDAVLQDDQDVADEGRPLQGIDILVVEDDHGASEMLAMVLSDRGAIVRTAANFDEAVAQAGRAWPDVLVSDIGLPGRDGYELIRHIEELTSGSYAPSPGVIYPALTYLEEAGYVTSSAEANKKLYTITDEGRTHLAENREAIAATLDFLARTGEQFNRFREFVRADWPFGGQPEDGNTRPEPPRAHGGEHGNPFEHDRPMKDAIPELDAARKALKAALKKARHGSEEQQARAADILRRAAADLDGLADDDIDL